MTITHKYNGANIIKRSGMGRLRNSVSGYKVHMSGGIFRTFKTLTEAKAFIDQVNTKN